MASAVQTLTGAMEAAGASAAEKIGMTFDIKNPKAAEAATKSGARLVTRITKQTEKALAKVIRRSVSDGIPPDDLARIIKGMVGLTEPQAMAVMNARESWLEAGLNAEKVEEKALAYGDKLLRQRANAIARTEISEAVHEGQRAAWTDAIEAGLLNAERTKRVWIVGPNSCDLCQSLEGQLVGMDEQFETSDGELIDGPPLHPNCVCTEGLEIAA